MVMCTKLKLQRLDDKVSKVFMFIKARSIIVISKIGETFLITSEKGLDEKVPIFGRLKDAPCLVNTFTTFKGEKLIAVGLANGGVLIKY